jgi:hypothetical protein
VLACADEVEIAVPTLSPILAAGIGGVGASAKTGLPLSAAGCGGEYGWRHRRYCNVAAAAAPRELYSKAALRVLRICRMLNIYTA